MIGRLKGTVAQIGVEAAIIDVAGVGYEIHAAPRTLERLGLGETATLAIETLVREDLIRLFGFESEAERQAFRLLQSVQGVGARHALALLQILPPADLYDAVTAEDVTAIARAHGVGRKIAQRIVTELQPKVGAVAGAGAAFARAAQRTKATPADPALAARADAISALSHLGYDGVEARRAVALAAEALDSPGVEALIKAALKKLGAA